MTDWTEIVSAAPGEARDAVDGVVPAWVLHPGNVAEVQACVRTAGERRAAIVVRGHGAHLAIGAPPARLDAVLALDRMGRIVDHQPGDMTVTVEAGCSLATLAEVLRGAGQWLPLDPPRAEATTVGGLVAANLSGPLRASQGTVRDLLIGLRTVGADGAVVAGGGRVVKNVAGYDLPKLHVGALGTLGVIVEATFKLRPRPAREEAVVIACRSVEAAAEAALDVLSDGVGPFWLEVAGPGGLPEGPGDGAAVVIGLAGIADEVEDARARAVRLAERRGCRAVAVADGAALRARLGEFPLEPAAAVLRAALLPTELGSFMVNIRGHQVRSIAHAANGVVRLAVLQASEVPILIATHRPELEARGGSLVVERAGPAVKAAIDVWGDPGPGIELMRGIKQTFDPAGLFAPGRFVAGL